jgi:hypothetical protein
MPSILSTAPDSKSLPRLLCLHGGGVNAAIFEAQSRSLIRHLRHSFRLVWADAPFYCDAHADVVDVYASYAPFRRWLRWLPEHAEIDSESCIEEIGYAIRTAMEDDDRAGGTGEWVGLMGFSQGAKMTASLLLEQQAREEKARRDGGAVETGLIGVAGINWRFGVLLAGRAPMSNHLDERGSGQSCGPFGGVSVLQKGGSGSYAAEADAARTWYGGCRAPSSPQAAARVLRRGHDDAA